MALNNPRSNEAPVFEVYKKYRSFLILIFLTLFFSSLISTLLAITLDEAYYYAWGQKLAFGYFDHPPAVALLSYFPQRLGTIFLGLLTLLLAAKLFKSCGIEENSTALLLLILFKFNLAGLVSGFLTTPDTPLIFFWLLAIHEAFYALKTNPMRWLTAGLATGLGLLSKYSMVLMGPIFLITLLKKPEQLKKPWPYLGGLLALLIFLPNLNWNYENDWPSFSFQLRRLGSISISENEELPKPEAPQKTELALQKLLIERLKIVGSEKAKTPTFQLPKSLNSFLEFTGGLFVLWGALIIPLLSLAFKYRRMPKIKSPLVPDAQILFKAALYVPLLFFACLSLFTKVEANWSAIYICSAIPFLAPYISKIKKGIYAAAFMNVTCLFLLALHAKKPFLPLKKDRILKETYGYELLAKHTENFSQPVFADTYQTTSMLRYYRQDSKTFQWPYINRPSEFTHNPHYSYDFSSLKEGKGFWLVFSEMEIPHFASFEAHSFEVLRDCRNGKLQVFSSKDFVEALPEECSHVHEWLLVEYVHSQSYSQPL